MSESTEPSYYEIALTNRQVVIAFVILLTLVLAIFLCGVWVGKNGQERLAGTTGTAPTHPSAAAEPEQLANMEEFKFFAEENAKKSGKVETLDKPDLASLDKPKPENRSPRESRPGQGTTLAQDIGSESLGNESRTQPETKPEPPAPKPAETQQAEPKPTAPPTTRPAPAQAGAGDGFVVQVFSTRDEPQARKVLSQLKGAGHKAFLSAVEVTGQTMYRVRVGPFTQRADAEKVADQVRRQMKLDPWVTAAGN